LNKGYLSLQDTLAY